ncbi:hypothetical protein BH10BAC4_BH10BAC4_02260 [soil metagenome]
MRFLLVCIVALLLSGCLSQPDCPGPASNMAQISFKNNRSGKAQAIDISMLEFGSKYFLTADSVSSVSIPVNPFTTETTFIINYTAILKSLANIDSTVTKRDTITVGYSVQNIIVSTDCGAYLLCKDLLLKYSSFKNEAKLVNNQLSTRATVNITIKL